MRRRMIDIFADHTGQSVARITTDIDRDYIVRGEQAVAYGLVDFIVPKRTAAEPSSGYAIR